MVIIDLRSVARDVQPQDVITHDNLSVKVSAVVYFRVINADKAVLHVEDYEEVRFEQRVPPHGWTSEPSASAPGERPTRSTTFGLTSDG